MSANERIPTAIVLCAGRGTRMNDNRTNKVCYEIAGQPAVHRLITNLKTAGITRFVVVVGDKADKVMECLSDIEGAVFVYQKVQNGTGNAAMIGLRAMKAMGLDTPALVVMGDKIITPDVFTRLIEGYNGSAAFVIQPKPLNQSGGRVVFADGKAVGIVEQMDVCLQKISEGLPRTEEELRLAAESFGLSEKKSKQLFEKAKTLKTEIKRIFCGKQFTADEIEATGFVNTATYMLNTELALTALSSVESDNAQGEVYMTDAINTIARGGDVKTVVVEEPYKLLTYSTMEELLRLERYFSPPAGELHFPTASHYLNKLSLWDEDTKKLFTEVYGNGEELINERRSNCIDLLNSFIAKYGDREAVIARSPGRVNLMGRHIEHRGGSINVMTISREMLVVASPRSDDTVNISNKDKTFPDRSFSILSHISRYDTQNWVEFIESDAILKTVSENRGDWLNYVKAAVLRLQLCDKSKPLCGMDMMFSGNIPMAAGLSSSSSIVVSTLEAALALNGSKLQTNRFISLCGEGEWFVGSRGGAGDHAAMKCGRAGKLTHLFFNPFSVGKSVDFPSEYVLIVANSFVEAKKSDGAKDLFNSKIASYEFGLMLLKKRFPEYEHNMRVLKDVNPATLSVPPSRIYEMLLTLPERMTPDEIRTALCDESARVEQILGSHRNPEKYDIRSVVLYGISECERAEHCIALLEKRDYAAIGRLMNTSHNGDRVYQNGKEYDYSASDLYLYKLINDLKSEEPLRIEAAQLYNQPGGYACSTKQIDGLVDYVISQDGVLGAQLSGAGLGGCIMILAEKAKSGEILNKLKNGYYDTIGKTLGAEIYSTVAGSGCLEV